MFNRPSILSFAAFLCLATAGCTAADEFDAVGSSQEALSAARQGPALGAAASYAVLANAAVTCTDGSIAGDVGTFLAAPQGSITLTNCAIAGAANIGTQGSQAAYADFLNTYAATANIPCDQYLTGTLAGVTLTPGVYCFAAAATLTGTLTLNGPSTATWLFKVGTLGTGALTGTNFNVVMANGGSPCNVTWWVAQAATMTDSNFIGTILTGAADTVTRGTFEGRTFSKADVTITGTTIQGCTTGSPIGTSHVKAKCNQGLGNGAEGCDPGNSNNHNPTNDESGGTPGNPGRH